MILYHNNIYEIVKTINYKQYFNTIVYILATEYILKKVQHEMSTKYNILGTR